MEQPSSPPAGSGSLLPVASVGDLHLFVWLSLTRSYAWMGEKPFCDWPVEYTGAGLLSPEPLFPFDEDTDRPPRKNSTLAALLEMDRKGALHRGLRRAIPLSLVAVVALPLRMDRRHVAIPDPAIEKTIGQ